jgi:hypothetical protein
MLKALFGSTVRVRILEFFLLNPDKKSDRRELARDFNLPTDSLRRELENLVALGILKEERSAATETEAPTGDQPNAKKKTEKKYFSAEQNFILYPEFKALFTKAQILHSQDFANGLNKIGQLKFLALTGFFTNQPLTRTDILIVGNVRRRAFLKLISKLEKDLGREVDFTIFSEKEFNYRREINDIFLSNILTSEIFILIDNLKTTRKI